MTLRPKLTKEERERRRRQNEEWRERKFREKQLKEFMSRLHHLFLRNDRRKSHLQQGYHDDDPDRRKREFAAAEHVDAFEEFVLKRCNELVELDGGFDREDDAAQAVLDAEWEASPEGIVYMASEKSELEAMERRQGVIDALLRGDKSV